jgi:hypothetical protein
VYVADVCEGKALAIDGAIDISSGIADGRSDWATRIPADLDVLVPCSSSHLLTDEAVQHLQNVSYIVGATNLPFATSTARASYPGVFIPEGISSAGAVIADSVEHHCPDDFKTADPDNVYQFTRNEVRVKSSEAAQISAQLQTNDITNVVPGLRKHKRNATLLGHKFNKWQTGSNAGETLAEQSASIRVEHPKMFTSVGINREAKVRTQKKATARAFSTTAKTASDVVIIGAGIMGLNIA